MVYVGTDVYNAVYNEASGLGTASRVILHKYNGKARK